MSRALGRCAELFTLLLVVTTTAWLVANSWPYFTLAEALPFLVEKGAIALESWWKTFFIAHVTGGVVCLAIGPLLIWNVLILRSGRLHALLGRTYVGLVLLWGAPAGLVLATTAKGGILGRGGFVVLGLLWWITTWRGVRAITSGRTVPHVAWMARSYAIATSALSFRVFHLALHAAGVPDRTNYIASIWGSLVVSLVVGECLAARAPRLLATRGPRRRLSRATSRRARSEISRPSSPPSREPSPGTGVLP